MRPSSISRATVAGQVAGRLDVDHGRLGQRVCEAPHAIRQAIVRVREGHGQQHRRGKSASAQHRGLVHHLAVVRPRRRQDPGVGTGQRGQHIHDARVLAQPHVEVGVAAVHDAAHAAGLQMRQQRPVRASFSDRSARRASGGTAMTERRRSWWVTGRFSWAAPGRFACRMIKAGTAYLIDKLKLNTHLCFTSCPGRMPRRARRHERQEQGSLFYPCWPCAAAPAALAVDTQEGPPHPFAVGKACPSRDAVDTVGARLEVRAPPPPECVRPPWRAFRRSRP